MNIILILIPITLVLVGLAVWAFFWAVSSGQFDELDTPAWEILREEEPADPRGAPAAERISVIPAKTLQLAPGIIEGGAQGRR